MTRIVAFVPAKGSSDRIPSKNLAILDGDHLFRRKLRQLLDCPLIDAVFLDTEDETVAALAGDLPVQRLTRPQALASNATDGHELFAWECAQVHADIYVQAICTAPFVAADTVTRAMQALLDAPHHDSLVAVSAAKQYTWGGTDPLYGRGRIPNSVDLPATLIESMSLYAVRRSDAPIAQRFGNSPLLFELTPTETIDVNWPEDLVLAETIAGGQRARQNLELQALAPYLSAPLISDITRDLGLDCALPQAIKPTSGARVWGRAKTLTLDAVQPGEDWRKIYDALKSYAFVRPGDVIVVENRLRDRAYFGNLNAQLAMRAGAVGAVIDGVTRDSGAVNALGFPVFARGTYAVDIRLEGVLRALNERVQIGSVQIADGDLIFGDQDGVMAIPAARWTDVKTALVDGFEREWRIGRLAALGADPIEIWRQLGDF